MSPRGNPPEQRSLWPRGGAIVPVEALGVRWGDGFAWDFCAESQLLQTYLSGSNLNAVIHPNPITRGLRTPLQLI